MKSDSRHLSSFLFRKQCFKSIKLSYFLYNSEPRHSEKQGVSGGLGRILPLDHVILNLALESVALKILLFWKDLQEKGCTGFASVLGNHRTQDLWAVLANL